jgi:potassium efflux system protein
MNPQLQPSLVSANELLTTTLFKVGKTSISLLWISKLILALCIILIFLNLFKRLLKDLLLVRLKLSQGNREAIATLISYSLGILGLVIILQVNGLDLASLMVVLGGLGVGIGFGLQDVTKNLVSGLTLLVEGKLQVGDYIEFAGLSGYIKEISIRSTIVRTFDGGDVVVPNSNLISDQVLNWSYKNFTGKIHLPIGVAYDSDPILVTETLLNSAYMEPTVLHEPPPRVIFYGFGENSLNFELWVWVSRIDEGISVRSSLNFIIEYNFRQAGIRIPFPQRDLWLRNPEPLRLQSIERLAELQAGSDSSQVTSIRSPQMVSIRSCLKQSPYFQECSDLRLREIIETGYRKVLSQSEILVKEGEMTNAFYIVLSGAIETIVIRLNKHVTTYYAGDLFGEAPVMLGVPYIATARALEETNLFVIHTSSFEKLLRSRPQLAEMLAQELAKEKEVYAEVRQQLQDMGLLGMNEQHGHFVAWVQDRIKKLFNI